METTETNSLEYYNNVLGRMSFSATTANGRGFLPPFVRGIGHLLYLMGRISDSRARNQTFIETELQATRNHWASIHRPHTAMSESSVRAFDGLADLLDLLIANIASFEDEDKIEAIRGLVNRALFFTATLDRELIGLRDSDAGYDI